MRAYHRHLGKRLVTLGILNAALIAVLLVSGCGARPTTGTAPHATPTATSGPAQPTATATSTPLPNATATSTPQPTPTPTPVPSQGPVEQSKEILADSSIDGPALWTSNPGAPNLGLASVLAWAGTDAGHSLNVMYSSDGVTYGGKVIFPENSNSRPAVAVQGPPTAIVLAWVGMDANHFLNLLCQGPACGTSAYAGSYKKLTLSDVSLASPALVRFGDGFLLAWTSIGPNHALTVVPFSLTTSSSGFELGARTVLSQFSSAAGPSLVMNPQNNQLVLSWATTAPSGQVAFATSGDGVAWSQPQMQTLSDASATGPDGFAVADTSLPTLWMTSTSDDPAHLVSVRFTHGLSQWPAIDERTLGEAAIGRPSLGYTGNSGQMLLAWTGTDSALNIATLATPATPTLDQRINTYIASLSTAQQIGQVVMMSVCASGYNASLNQALTEWDVGNAIIYTSCNYGPTQPPTAAGLHQLDQTMQSNASRPGALLLAIDEEGGTVDQLAPYFGGTPSARQLAATGYPQNAYDQGQTDAAHLRAVGLNQDFAPVVDVDQGGGAGTTRMFGTTVGTVTTYAGAFLDGLQQNGVSGGLKHWPGLGASTGNPDLVLPTISSSRAQLNAVDFAVFGDLLYQHPGMVMATTVLVPAYDTHTPADLSSILINGVLRGQLGYQGVVITDAMGAQGIVTYMQQQGYADPTQGIAEASVRAMLAGDDLILCPRSQTTVGAVVTAMTQAVQSGRISRARLLASVHRIIRLKVELGLMTVP